MYLRRLDETDIYRLSLVLGLSECRARRIRGSDTFHEDMVSAWLQKVDQVSERGALSWRRLVEALRSDSIRQNGIANNIVKDKNIN